MRVENDQEKYLNRVFGLDDAELAPVRERLTQGDVERMAISGHEARLLQFFIRALGVKTIVEVGTLYGFSGLCMAKALPEDGQLITLEMNPSHWEHAQLTFAASPAGRRVRSLKGDALELLAQIEGEAPFDMMFIDANKSGYSRYLDWAEKNVRKGGLIVGDNTFLWGGVWDKPTEREMGQNAVAAMKEFNQRLSDPARYDSTLIPTKEGMTIARKLF